jgi:hypothetical protein
MIRQISHLLFNNTAKLFLAMLLIASAQTVFAQDLGTLSGTVTDQQGAVIAGATVTVASTATAVERTVTTSEDGTYSIPAKSGSLRWN